MNLWSRRAFNKAATASALTLPATGLFHASSAMAQTEAKYPSKPISIAVPFGSGGSLDLTTRLIAARLAERLSQSVIVENVTGAGGSVGIQKVIKSAPDGYSLLMAGDSPLNAAPPSNPKTAQVDSFYRHDMLNELVPVGMVNTAPMILVAHPSVKANNFDEFLALVRANPGKFNYATSGIGTILHLTMEVIKQQAKVFVTHIPYRGGAQIVTDVIGNQIEMAMLINATALPSIKAGTLKALAVAGEKRLPWLPNVPAISESAGFKGFDVVSWAGLYAPAKTPAPIVARINQELDAVLKMEAVRSRLAEFGALPIGGSPDVFAKFIQADRARFANVLRTIALA